MRNWLLLFETRINRNMGSTDRFASLLPYIFRQWKWLVGIVILTLLMSAAGALQPWPVKVLVDYGLRGDALPPALRGFLESIGIAETSFALILVAAALSMALFALNSVLAVGLSLAWSMD